MPSLVQVALIVAVFGSLTLSVYTVSQRNYQQAVGGVVIAVIALVALFL
jgi:hypothetical protein